MTHITRYAAPTGYLDLIVDEVEFEDTLWDDSLLGCSPAELNLFSWDEYVDSLREIDYATEYSAELRLWEDGFSPL